MTSTETGAALQRAHAAHAEAHSTLRDADAAAAAAREAFTREPTAEGEDRVEQAEREQRKAQRFHDARERTLRAAETEHERAVEEERRAELERISHERRQLLPELRPLFEAVERFYVDLDQTVTAIEQVLVRDALLARDVLALRGRPEPPLDPSIVRAALGLRLARTWKLPDLPEPPPVMTAFRVALGRLGEPATQNETRERFRVAHDEYVSLTGAEIADWLRLGTQAQWNDQSQSAARRKAAAALLVALEDYAVDLENIQGDP